MSSTKAVARRCLRCLRCRLRFAFFLFWALAGCLALRAGPLAVRVCIKAVNGHAMFSTNGVAFAPLQPGDYEVGAGLAIKTDPVSTVDFILLDSGTALRMMPDTSLEFNRLNKVPAGEQVVSDTSLKLLKGSIIGVQRKLAVPSRFVVVMPDGVARIVGTEYVINASGAVSVLSGEVTVNYNLPHNGGSIKVTIPQGFTFNPATGTVVPTTPAFLQHIIDDINTVEENAQTFRVSGATIVVKPEEFESPDHEGHHHEGDHDHDGDRGGDHGGDGGHGGPGGGHGGPGGGQPIHH